MDKISLIILIVIGVLIFRQFLSGTGDWILWSTIAASTILYSITLYKKHPEIRSFIKEQLKN